MCSYNLPAYDFHNLVISEGYFRVSKSDLAAAENQNKKKCSGLE